jgi:hypothetical protein
VLHGTLLLLKPKAVTVLTLAAERLVSNDSRIGDRKRLVTLGAAQRAMGFIQLETRIPLMIKCRLLERIQLGMAARAVGDAIDGELPRMRIGVARGALRARWRE